jgi:D-3-phosphoglycerate dehydrogenase
MQAVLSSGIQIRVTEGANRDAVGEMTLGLLIALLRNIPKSNQEVKAWQWKREENRGEELTNKTVGIIGFGNTGSAFAKKLRGFEVTVLAYDKYKKGFSKDNVQEVPLEVLFAEADICSFHIPLNSETRHLGDASFFEKFTKPVWILNLSRGEIIDTKALLSALDKGKVKGAALDVLENERFARLSTDWKEIYSDLFLRNNILLSPHIGGWTFTSRQNIYNDLLHHLDEAMKTWQQ